MAPSATAVLSYKNCFVSETDDKSIIFSDVIQFFTGRIRLIKGGESISSISIDELRKLSSVI